MMHLGLMLDDAYAMLNEGLRLINYMQYAGLTRRCYSPTPLKKSRPEIWVY